MPVDVVTDIFIARPRDAVHAFACDPVNAPAWYVNIESAVWKDATHIAFVARFLGRRLEYTYEVAESVAGERFVMRTSRGPFPMETTYTFEDTPGGTRMTLRNRGEPAGFSKLVAPMMAAAMRRANRKDLEALKRLLESR